MKVKTSEKRTPRISDFKEIVLLLIINIRVLSWIGSDLVQESARALLSRQTRLVHRISQRVTSRRVAFARLRRRPSASSLLLPTRPLARIQPCSTPQNQTAIEYQHERLLDGKDLNCQVVSEDVVPSLEEHEYNSFVSTSVDISDSPTHDNEYLEVSTDKCSDIDRNFIGKRPEQWRSPINYGGHPRVADGSGQPEERKTVENKSRTDRAKQYSAPDYEVICWKAGRRWDIGVEIRDDLCADKWPLLMQGSEILQKANGVSNRWLLADLRLPIVICMADGQKQEIRLDRPYLLFKLGSMATTEGRRATGLTTGTYLVVVPGDWTWRDTEAAYAPVEPEQTSLPDYLGHLIEVKERSRLTFATRTGPQNVGPSWYSFRLTGHCIADGENRRGPLFGGDTPPQLQAELASDWDEVGCVVLGQEGRGRNRWRNVFTPSSNQRVQDLSYPLSGNKSGWYFVRIYDKDNSLLTSFDFRLALGLYAISIEDAPLLPGPSGHQPVRVTFRHDISCDIMPKADRVFAVLKQDGETVFSIPAVPEAERTLWSVRVEDGSDIEVVTEISRIWWNIGSEKGEPTKWLDKPMLLSRDVFSATSENAIWFRVPTNAQNRKLLLRFEKEQRDFSVSLKKSLIAIPARSFEAAEELSRPGRAQLIARLSPRDKVEHAVVSVVDTAFVCSRCGIRLHDRQKTKTHANQHINDLYSTFNKQNSYPFISRITIELLMSDTEGVWKYFYKTPKYEDLVKARGHELNIPSQIYECDVCGTYVLAEVSGKNPTDAIYNHYTKEHRDSQKIIKVISNLDLIREKILRDLPPALQCRLCGEILSSDFGGHLRRSHANASVLQCQLCNEIFMASDDTRYHLKSRHSDKKLIECSVCHYIFSEPTDQDLVTHLVESHHKNLYLLG